MIGESPVNQLVNINLINMCITIVLTAGGEILANEKNKVSVSLTKEQIEEALTKSRKNKEQKVTLLIEVPEKDIETIGGFDYKVGKIQCLYGTKQAFEEEAKYSQKRAWKMSTLGSM